MQVLKKPTVIETVRMNILLCHLPVYRRGRTNTLSACCKNSTRNTVRQCLKHKGKKYGIARDDKNQLTI